MCERERESPRVIQTNAENVSSSDFCIRFLWTNCEPRPILLFSYSVFTFLTFGNFDFFSTFRQSGVVQISCWRVVKTHVKTQEIAKDKRHRPKQKELHFVCQA